MKLTMKLIRLNDHVAEVNHCLTSENLYKNRYQKTPYRLCSVSRVLRFESKTRSRHSWVTNFTVIWSVQTKAHIIFWPIEAAISCNAFRKFTSH